MISSKINFGLNLTRTTNEISVFVNAMANASNGVVNRFIERYGVPRNKVDTSSTLGGCFFNIIASLAQIEHE